MRISPSWLPIVSIDRCDMSPALEVIVGGAALEALKSVL